MKGVDTFILFYRIDSNHITNAQTN